MASAIDVGPNSLLQALVACAPGPWQSRLELVELPLNEVLHEPYVSRQFVYFPVTAVVSLLFVLEDGSTSQIALIGREGVAGMSLSLVDGISASRAVVLSAGTAFRIRPEALKEELMSNVRAANVMLRFAQALLTQMAQTIICNRHHSVEQHFCRWILSMLDRQPGMDIAVTHDSLGILLGARRASVSLVAQTLQKDGAITYRRGEINVVNRLLMEQRVCECYRVVKSQYACLLPNLYKTIYPALPPSMRTDGRRLEFLQSTGILDTPPEDIYDGITDRAAELFSVPIAIVSLLDAERDWYKSIIGFDATESPAEVSFCSVFFTIDDDVVVVEDTRDDLRFSTHPYVLGRPFLRFYAAVRLVYRGMTVGTLCICDIRKRTLDPRQVQALKGLADEALAALLARTVH